jgi:hypothetical protein
MSYAKLTSKNPKHNHLAIRIIAKSCDAAVRLQGKDIAEAGGHGEYRPRLSQLGGHLCGVSLQLGKRMMMMFHQLRRMDGCDESPQS